MIEETNANAFLGARAIARRVATRDETQARAELLAQGLEAELVEAILRGRFVRRFRRALRNAGIEEDPCNVGRADRLNRARRGISE